MFWKKKTFFEKFSDSLEVRLENSADGITEELKDAKLSDSLKIKENVLGYAVIVLTGLFLIYYFGNYSSDTFIGFTLPVILMYSIISVFLYNLWRIGLRWVMNFEFLSGKHKYRTVFLILFSTVVLSFIFAFLLYENIGLTGFGGKDGDSGWGMIVVAVWILVWYVIMSLFIPARPFKYMFVILSPMFIAASTVLSFWLVPATYFGGLKETSGYLVFKNESAFRDFTKIYLAADNFYSSSHLRNTPIPQANELFSKSWYDPVGKIFLYETKEFFQDDKYRYLSGNSQKKKVPLNSEFWTSSSGSFLVPIYWKYDNKLNDHNLNSITGIWLENLPKFLSANDIATQSGVLNHQKILATLYGAIAYQNQDNCKESFDKNLSDSERISVLMGELREDEPHILNQNLLNPTGACKELKQFVTEYRRNSRAGLYEEGQLDQDYKDFLDFVWSISVAYIKTWELQRQSLRTENINTIDNCIRSWDTWCSRVLESSWSWKLKNKYTGADGNWSWYVRKLIDE